MATLVDPSIIMLEDFRVEIETAGDFTAGETIGYRHAPVRRSAPVEGAAAPTANVFSPNAKVAVDLNVERFLTLLIDRIGGSP
jgi:inosine-uridine nucleoside N-ribohydrolase